MIAPHSKTSQTCRTHDPFCCTIDVDLNARRHETNPSPCRTPGQRRHLAVFCFDTLAPLEPLGGRFEHVAQPAGLKMGEAELQRVRAGGGGQFVHETFAAKLFAVAASARYEPWRNGVSDRHERHASCRMRYGVSTAEPPELMLMKSHDVSLPCSSKARLDVDHRRRAELGPGEFLLARPLERDRLARGLGQPCGLDGGFAGVLAAESAAGVGHDHAHLVVGQPERARQFARESRNGFCVPVQTVSLPSCHSATAARVSIGACWM